MEQRRELMKENYCLPSRYWEPGAEEEQYKEENDADNYDGDEELPFRWEDDGKDCEIIAVFF